MKKLAIILAALMLSTSVMTGCGKDTTEKPVEKNGEENVQEVNKDDVKEGEEKEDGDVAVSDSDITEFANFIEDTVAKYAPRTELDEEILGTIGGVPVSATAIRYRTQMYEQYLAYGFEEEMLVSMIGDPCKQNAALIAFACENGITVSEEEIKTTIEATLANLEASYGDGLDAALATSPYTKHYYCLNAIYSTIYSKVADKFLSDVEGEYVQSCLADAMANEDLLRAKHILIQFPENEDGSEVTEEQKAATLEEANAVLEEVNAMADISEFDALVDKYNDDPGMVDNKVGYYFGSGEMVEEFENATRELEIGKTSGLVETTYGYHIILRLPIEEESFKSSNKHLEYAESNLLVLIDETLAEEEFVPAENYEARVQEFKDELKAPTEEAPAEEEAHDHSHEEAEAEATEEAAEEAPAEEAAE